MLLSTLGSLLVIASAANAGLIVERDLNCGVQGWPSETHNFNKPATKRSATEDALISVNTTRSLVMDALVGDELRHALSRDAISPSNQFWKVCSG